MLGDFARGLVAMFSPLPGARLGELNRLEQAHAMLTALTFAFLAQDAARLLIPDDAGGIRSAGIGLTTWLVCLFASVILRLGQESRPG